MAKRKPAAVMGSLVNLKNVATHKSVALTIHIPAEAAQEALAAFGWPTMVDPVPVAVARLEGAAPREVPRAEPLRNTEELPEWNAGEGRWSDETVEAAKQAGPWVCTMGGTAATAEWATPGLRPIKEPPERARHWAEMTPAQQTGVIRNEWDFLAFAGAQDSYEARDFIRKWCRVKSCADILPGTEAAAKWAELQVRYGNFLRQRRGAA